jgi:hypothetical protein
MNPSLTLIVDSASILARRKAHVSTHFSQARKSVFQKAATTEDDESDLIQRLKRPLLSREMEDIKMIGYHLRRVNRFFNSLPRKVQEHSLKTASLQFINNKHTMFEKDDRSSSFYMIIKGIFHVYSPENDKNPDGEEQAADPKVKEQQYHGRTLTLPPSQTNTRTDTHYIHIIAAGTSFLRTCVSLHTVFSAACFLLSG